MTTLALPSFEGRLLETVREEVATGPVPEWPPQSLQLCLDILHGIRANAAHMRSTLKETLAEGVEFRGFVRDYGPLLALVDDHIAKVRGLVARLVPAQDAASGSLKASLRSLEQEYQAFRDLLAEVLSRASPPRPVDWERIRAAEEAYARGDTKPFSPR